MQTKAGESEMKGGREICQSKNGRVQTSRVALTKRDAIESVTSIVTILVLSYPVLSYILYPI